MSPGPQALGTRAEKGRRFRELHRAPRGFVIPNPWDPGTAKLLASMGFEALATTSAGLAFALGRRDGAGQVSPEAALANARSIAEATDLPVSADLENGGADSPARLAALVERAAAAGLAGASIEDTTADPSRPIHDVGLAVERVQAASEACRGLGAPFVLTARADGLLHGETDLDAIVRRLQAFQEAGAEVLYAPGLATLDAVASVIASVDRPVNVLLGSRGLGASIPALLDLGVARISVGSALARRALAAVEEAAAELLGDEPVRFPGRAWPMDRAHGLFGEPVQR